jgi:hypothetical protein
MITPTNVKEAIALTCDEYHRDKRCGKGDLTVKA